MGKNRFEVNTDDTTAILLKLTGTAQTPADMAKLFYRQFKIPKIISSYTPEVGKKNAIILLGYSCVGKSTYAQELQKSLPDFEILSMDLCAKQEFDENPASLLLGQSIKNSDLGLRTFGEMLEKSNNLIIDGCFLHINIRASLIRTLDELQYATCIFSFLNISEKLFMERIATRVMQFMAAEKLGVVPSLATTDWIEEYQKVCGIPKEEIISEFQKNALFPFQNGSGNWKY